jgi:hypothetical protein
MKVIRVKLTLRSIGLLSALTPAILAQTQGPSTPVAPDVEALEKFIADFPGSSSLGAANQAILDTLIKNWPERPDKILAQANKLINAAPSQRGRLRSKPLPFRGCDRSGNARRKQRQ